MSLIEVGLAIIAFYSLLVAVDILLIRRKLSNLISDKKNRGTTYPLYYTLAGRSLHKLAENLQHKIAVLNWQIENTQQNTLSAHVVENESGKSGSFFQGVINALFTKLRTDAVFILTSVQDGSNHVEIQQAHARNSWALPPKLSSYLVNFYNSYFIHNDHTILGLRDGFQSKSLTGDFYLFGYRYVIALPVNYNNHEGKAVKGLMWLGYNKNSEPYANEIVIAKDLCTKIENEFTSQRIIEELSTKVKEEKVINKQRNEFLAHVSHDIRSPMNNIRSIINLMRLEEKDREQAELLDTALGNCNDVEELINTILDYTRYQAGQLVNKSEDFDIHFMAEEVVSNQKVEARLKGIDLILDYDSNCSVFLHADKKQLKRVINNLVNNAIKYTRHGSINVHVSANEVSGICTIKVIDTGVGMTQEQLKMLFTPFYRFHQKEAEGIGLGLTLCRILVELNGGNISVESEVNSGSTFEIRFPCQVSHHSELQAEFQQKELTDNIVSTIEVLVLDDNAVAVESLGKMLLRQGFNVIKCYTVSDAISIINFSPPDFLITDWHMPDGGAKRLIKYLKMINSKTRISVLTGSSDENTKNEIFKLGVEKVFCKSDDFEYLQQWLKEIQSEYTEAVKNQPNAVNA